MYRCWTMCLTLRLMEETKRLNNTCADKWMLEILKRNVWWLRREHAAYICGKLHIDVPAELFYYHSVYIWLPDTRWGLECMPSCMNGCSNSHAVTAMRTVFVIYGNKVNVNDGKPLFNNAAWKKANNVLHEILSGHSALTPPDSTFTTRSSTPMARLLQTTSGSRFWSRGAVPA